MPVTRFPNGVGTSAFKKNLGEFGMPDPTKWHTYFNDFDAFAAADWTETEVGTASAPAIIDADGGVLRAVTGALANDSDFFQKVGESFLFEAGKQLIFKARIRTNSAILSEIVMGLQITDTTPAAVSDGVFFIKPTHNDPDFNFLVEKNGTATTVPDVATIVNDTWLELGFHYDGKSTITVFVNDAQAGKAAVTNLPDDEEMTISFGVQNGSAAARQMDVDYIFVAKER